MRIYKVVVSKGEKEYFSVAPLMECKVKSRANKLHEEFPHGTVTVLSTDNPSEGWNECWIISPEKREAETYADEEDE